MGSDLYMEQRSWRPRQSRAFLNRAKRWEIYVDTFSLGWRKTQPTFKSTVETDSLIETHFDIVDERPR